MSHHGLRFWDLDKPKDSQQDGIMDFFEHFGPWAIITEAHTELGQAFAYQLADLDLNLVLTGKHESRLIELSDTIESHYGVKTRTIAIDLEERDCVDVLYVRCADLDIGLVVSNDERPQTGTFLKFGLDQVRKSIQLNISTHTDLARYFGDQILERRQGRGGLLFMSSLVGLDGAPHLSVYAAAKAYILSFAEALHQENKQHGLHVSLVAPNPASNAKQSVRPSPVARLSCHKIAQPSAYTLTVNDALNAIMKNTPVYIPGALSRFRFATLRRFFFPQSAKLSLFNKLSQHDIKLSLNTDISRLTK